MIFAVIHVISKSVSQKWQTWQVLCFPTSSESVQEERLAYWLRWFILTWSIYSYPLLNWVWHLQTPIQLGIKTLPFPSLLLVWWIASHVTTPKLGPIYKTSNVPRLVHLYHSSERKKRKEREKCTPAHLCYIYLAEKILMRGLFTSLIISAYQFLKWTTMEPPNTKIKQGFLQNFKVSDVLGILFAHSQLSQST